MITNKEHTELKRTFNNRIEYHNDTEQLHRLDGPAVEYNNGYRSYFINGYRHREDGPAREWNDGRKSWYINGQLHREDGPAIEYPNGYKAWFINGMKYTEQEWMYKIIKIKLKRLLDL